MNKLRALKNKKGFTLVEIIVVLVILAILAAFGIPSMIGFINDARGKAYVAEARAVNIALQSIATEDAASANSTITDAELTEPHDTLLKLFGTNEATYTDRLNRMLTPDVTNASDNIIEVAVDKGRILGLVYQNGDHCVKLVPGSTAETSTTETLSLKD